MTTWTVGSLRAECALVTGDQSGVGPYKSYAMTFTQSRSSGAWLELAASVVTAARHSFRSEPRLSISSFVVGCSQSRSRPENPLDLATEMEESMNDFRELLWLAMLEKMVGLKFPPPMDSRVLTFWLLRRTVFVNSAIESGMVTLLVPGISSANAQKR
nr:hypothetical protein Iba_chr13dCG11060 [Ipomoea batatas]